MASQRAFAHFAALPEGIRNDIWERAARVIFTTPSVRFVIISRREPDEVTESLIRDNATTAATIRAQAEADPSWDWLTSHDHKMISVAKAVEQALLEYNTSLISIVPGKDDWPFADLAAVCPGAYKGVKWVLKMAGKRRGNNVSSIFGPTEHSIICLEGPEVDSIRYFPFFETFMICPRDILMGNQQPQWTDRQIVVVGKRPRPDSDMWNPLNEYDTRHCPSFPELYPPAMDVRRVAFVYQEQDGFSESFHTRLGLYALWPPNLPNLKEIYLIDKSIKLRTTATQPNPGEISPSFAGCQGTFHVVPPGAVGLWNIHTVNGDLLPVFISAASLERGYRRGTPPVPQVLVKVLAFIPHARRK